MNNILEVKNLSTSFFTHAGEIKTVKNISFNIETGETIDIVGESGSGKSVTALSIMNLLPFPGRIVNGTVNFADTDLTTLKEPAPIVSNE